MSDKKPACLIPDSRWSCSRLRLHSQPCCTGHVPSRTWLCKVAVEEVALYLAEMQLLGVLQVLGCAKQLEVWGGEADGLTTYYDMIARDREVVKMVLLLTGSIEGMKENVLQYIGHFNQYSFLWQKDLATEYAAFMSTNPSLEVRCWLMSWLWA